MILHLGVMDIPYQVGRKGSTTGKVADILEGRYGIMQAFWNTHGDKYLNSLVIGSVQAMEAAVTGRPQRVSAKTTLSKMQGDFRRFISSREVEKAVRAVGPMRFPVPTLAALKGVSHRKKHPYAKGPRRPSFRDTGLYMASFRAWIT